MVKNDLSVQMSPVRNIHLEICFKGEDKVRKLLILLLVLVFMFSGCALFQKPCTPAGSADLDKAKAVMAGIQQYYNPLKDLVASAPTVGPILAVTIPLALSAADTALDALGKMIASGCAADNTINLAQLVLSNIKNLFAQTQVQELAAKRGLKLPK